MQGWIVMKGADCEGLWTDEPHKVYWDREEAQQAADAITKKHSRSSVYGEVVEVEVDFPLTPEVNFIGGTSLIIPQIA